MSRGERSCAGHVTCMACVQGKSCAGHVTCMACAQGRSCDLCGTCTARGGHVTYLYGMCTGEVM